MTEKERLLKVLGGSRADRPPVICPGGMMTMASREVMVETGCVWPEVHRDAEKMASLSIAMHDSTGLENLGIPFCMTVEAEAWGGEVEDGDEVTEPCVVDYPLREVPDWRGLKSLDPLRDGRLPTIVKCTGILSRRMPHVPVIGNLVGPLSLATSLIDAITLFKALRKTPAEVHSMLEFLTENCVRYGEALIEAGADVVVVADPSATGEILGPAMFREFALPYLNRLALRFRALGRPVITHICGNIKPVLTTLGELASEGLSVDSTVDIIEAKKALPGKVLMGNVSTRLLQNGRVEHIKAVSANLISSGVDILAPACGISAKTPVGNIKTMKEAATGI